MSVKKNSMEGNWTSSNIRTDDDNVEYTIESAKDGYMIYAEDSRDGEELEISDIKWDGQVLSFKSFMPSTQRIAFNRFRLKQNGRVEAKFTFTEYEELKKTPDVKIESKHSDVMEGRWVGVQPFDENEITQDFIIKKLGNKFSVKSEFALKGHKLEVSDVKWNGETLSFMTLARSTGRSCFNQLKINSIGNMDFTYTFSVVEDLKRIS